VSLRSETFEHVLHEARSRRGVALMGVCNVTPDSFSDGGAHYSLRDACARVDAVFGEGADIVDIGAESTRPGAPAVPAQEQLRRMLEVVRYAASCTRPGMTACVSVDTTSPEVAAACLDAGASVVNDVSCLRDEGLAHVVASHGAAFVLMHARGTQAEMRGFSDYPDSAYSDIVRDVLIEWTSAAERAVQLGVPRGALVMDPGLGFAKNVRQSAQLLRSLPELVAAVEAPVLVGASRKSFLKLADADAGPTERIGASIAAALHAARAGAAILRVHDVRATRQALDFQRVLYPPPARPDVTERRPAHA
jgi:dihydropteroate synthase